MDGDGSPEVVVVDHDSPVANDDRSHGAAVFPGEVLATGPDEMIGLMMANAHEGATDRAAPEAPA